MRLLDGGHAVPEQVLSGRGLRALMNECPKLGYDLPSHEAHLSFLQHQCALANQHACMQPLNGARALHHSVLSCVSKVVLHAQDPSTACETPEGSSSHTRTRAGKKRQSVRSFRSA